MNNSQIYSPDRISNLGCPPTLVLFAEAKLEATPPVPDVLGFVLLGTMGVAPVLIVCGRGPRSKPGHSFFVREPSAGLSTFTAPSILRDRIHSIKWLRKS